ncbi:MAG: AmmeMemoRadiSam system protein A [Dissulfurispiraceae bacterium]|jgi:AmmeMemoRadiSam system protein A|nr:AmmeMemoRadiSam system protein A [Dissulfurispiraceae bacterium]
MHPFAALAKSAVEEYIRNGSILPEPEELSSDLQSTAAAFICLKSHGDLRGCIGTFMPAYKNLFYEIVNNSIAAATKDPRFEPVSADELGDIQYTVDVLSEPEKVEDISELDPKKYGVIVSKGNNRGLLLPDLEGVNTVEEQLRIAKMKAYIDPNDDDISISRFVVQRYK